MSVHARFWVESITDTANSGARVTLRASVRGPQQEWSKYTPTGQLEMGILNESAATWFRERLGTDIALTFDDIPVDPAS